jgi:hypothetical protein
MNEYTRVIEHMEKRRKERKAKRIEKEISRQETLELIGFFSFPILVIGAMFI